MNARSAPLPTRRIAEELAKDQTKTMLMRACPEYAAAMTPGQGGAQIHWFAWCPRCRPHIEAAQLEAERTTLAEPKDTDNGQCWTEEIFSLL